MDKENHFEQSEWMDNTELTTLVEQLMRELDEASTSLGGSSEMFEKHKQLYKDFIQNLLAQKHRFAHIFKTEKGSIYFTLHGGQSLRIKDFKYGYKLQPLSSEIKFIQENSEQHDVPFGVGSTPYESFRTQGEENLHHTGHKVTEILK
jgi:hypothetical protein